MSVEGDTYKEKYENCRCAMQTLQRQLQAEKLRGQNVEAVVACLDEERDKNKALAEKTKQLERGIAVLQSRLEKHGENSALTLGDGEMLRPGTSRSTLESLMAEIATLKRNQKYLNVDPARMEQALQENEKHKKKVKQLEGIAESLRQNLEKADAQLKASDSDKDKRILELEAVVSDLERNKDTQSVLCHSLSEETTSLRQQLKDTMRQMQLLLRQLEHKQSPHPPPVIKAHDNDASAAAQQAQIQQLMEQVKAQEAQLEEVTKMNTRWQTYNKQREQYVQDLKQKLADEQQAGGNAEQLQQTIQQLQNEVVALRQQRQQVEEDNKRLQQQIHELRRARAAAAMDEEQRNVYEAQIRVIKEDFQQERDDRAREHERAQRLEEKLAEVKAQLESVQRQQMLDFADRRQRSLENYEQQYYQRTYGGQGRYQPLGVQQSYVARGQEPRYECDDDDEDNDPNRPEDTIDAPADDILKCPKCAKQFKFENHDELLEHLDKDCE